MNERITAIIPAKAMSGRLPHKNTLPFGESNLLVHKIRQLKQVDAIKEIIVSSEDDEILAMAAAEGVRAIKRPYEFSAETKPFQDFLYYIVGEATEDHVMWACCTSPMVDVQTYNRGCKTYFEKLKEGYDSLITVMEYHHYLLDKEKIAQIADSILDLTREKPDNCHKRGPNCEAAETVGCKTGRKNKE